MSSLYDQFQSETKTSSGGLYAQYLKENAPPDPNSFGQIVKNTVSDLGSFAVNTGKDIWGALTAKPAPKSLDMQESLKAGWDAISTTVQDTAKKLQTPLPNLSQPKDVQIKNLVGVGEGAMALLNNFFLGITAPMKAAASIPVVGYVADGVNNLFSALGVGGADVASKAVDGLPMSQQTRDTIRPLAMEVGALTAQIVAGKLGGDGVAKVKEKSKAILDTINSELQVAKTTVQGGIPKDIKVSGESVAQPVSFFNQYQAEKALPVIQMGAKAPETLPVAASSPADTTKAPSGYSYAPVEAPVSPETPITAPITAKVGEVVPTTETPIVGEKTVTKAASDINTTLVKQGFDALTPEEQSQYKAGSYAGSDAKVATMMDNNIEAVKEMARTGKGIPSDVFPQGLWNSIEKLATHEGDGQLLKDLAKSPLGTKRSGAAQTLGSAGYNANEHSVVEAINQIEESKQVSLKKKGIDIAKETVKDETTFKNEVKASRSSRQSWSEFAKQIICNI